MEWTKFSGILGEWAQNGFHLYQAIFDPSSNRTYELYKNTGTGEIDANTYLGRFTTIEEAKEVADKDAEQENGENGR